MRIIAGQRRGHRIDGPTTRDTRPTSDMVRESIFNILGDRVEELLVIDLFAGTGALGLEALSRGARRAIFVEIHRENVALIRRNLATLRYEDRGIVLGADVYRWARKFDPGDDGPVLVLIDPPYREYQNHPERIAGLLAELAARLPAGSILVVETSKHTEASVLPDPETWDCRVHGSTVIAVRWLGGTEEPPLTPEPADA